MLISISLTVIAQPQLQQALRNPGARDMESGLLSHCSRCSVRIGIVRFAPSLMCSVLKRISKLGENSDQLQKEAVNT